MRDTDRSPDLAACDNEPIHIPGSVQPHGILLAIDRDGRVFGASDNATELWGTAIGRPIEELIGPAILGDAPAEENGNARYAGQFAHRSDSFDLFVHRTAQGLIVELERTGALRPETAQVLDELLAGSTSIAAAQDLVAAGKAAAQAVRSITGYDRVMIYRFLDDGSGEVIAEARAEDIEPLLNHRYPATDIPRQARALYLANPIRVIPDAAYTPVPLRAEREPVDLSGALFRSVSPVHLQYLKNMGVGASASVSIIHDGELWGLIACHHRTARPVGHERREMARQVALTLEAAIYRLEEQQAHREELDLTRKREELLPKIAAAGTLREGLMRDLEDLRDILPAHGFALVIGDATSTVGVTPAESALEQLVEWLTRPTATSTFVSDHLASEYEPARDWPDRASGLLALIVSRQPLTLLMWFRAEELETVNWAGNPHEPFDREGPSGTLCPRRSFELWVEQVRGRSAPWRPAERDAARRLAERLEEVGRIKALTRMNQHLGESLDAKETALVEKDLMMREVHHRVQNNLQLVTSMLRLQEREIEDEGSRRQLELARDRVKSISVLHRRLWRSDDLEMVGVDSFLSELVDDLANAWGPDWRREIEVDVSPVKVPGHAAVLLGLIVTELLTNAFKHAYGGRPGPIVVRAADGEGDGGLALLVEDSGVGTDGSDRPGSFGSKLVKRLVQQIGAELEFSSNDPGTVVRLSVPPSALVT